MFDALSEKLNAVFGRLTGKGRLTERDVDEGLREVRLAMLEADVNFRVARDFVQRVRERAVGSEVLEHLSPGQQIVKIVNEELVGILGGESSRLTGSDRPPAVLMLVGLQGPARRQPRPSWPSTSSAAATGCCWLRATCAGRPPWNSWRRSAGSWTLRCTA